MVENASTQQQKGNIQFDLLSNKVIGCAIAVQRELGPGLLESVHEQCLAHELRLNGIASELQKAMPVEYKRVQIDCGYRLDLFVEGRFVAELKAVACIEPIHEAQVLTYLKVARVKAALLISFNVRLLKDGIKRFVV